VTVRDVQIEVEDDEGHWVEVESLDESAPDDRHYLVKRDGASVSVLFGDGLHGRRPPAGTDVNATYRNGLGSTGDVLLAVALQRLSSSPTEDVMLRAVIRSQTDAVSFDTYQDFQSSADTAPRQ
jgi:hypothetical protein